MSRHVSLTKPLTPSVLLRTQSSEGQRAERQTEIAQGDIGVAGNRQEINNDEQQPDGHDISEYPRLNEHADAGDDLDDTDQHHELMTMTAEDIVCGGRQVFIPVNQYIEELIQAGQNRRNGEADTENLKCLLSVSIYCTG